MNHYETLGVSETATQDEIKKAYRKLATKHHPDKGGDTATFQKIAQAYDTVGDESKRAQYDAQRSGGFGGGEFDPFAHAASMGQGWQDVSSMFGQGTPFEQFFRGARPQAHRRRNRDLNIRITVNLKQSFTGCDLEANYQLPNGKKQTVIIEVPEGIVSGQIIRYQGMGDDTDPSVARGDLNVTVMVEHSQQFERKGDDLVTYCLINPIEAMTGCTKTVSHISGTSIRFNLRAGLQHGTEFASPNLGFKNRQGRHGNFIIIIGIEIPIVTDPDIKQELENIYSKITNNLDKKD
jgi:DnaJ-class molecular chaperone